MKRILAILAALAMLLAACLGAAAEQDEDGGIMVVANCESWVSLRAAPDTGSERLAEVPLGALVKGCDPISQEFIRCEYQGQTGYILSQYLRAPALAAQADGLTVIAVRSYVSSGAESMEVICMDAQGGERWRRVFQSPFGTELDCTDTFMGGTADDPMVMVHVLGIGLRALELQTGEDRWAVPSEAVNLGGSLSTAVAEDGTMYIGGYYGPDPVAISAEGKVLWQAQTEHDAYWMTGIELTDEGVVTSYECVDEHGAEGRICYGYDGQELWVAQP